MSQHPSLKTSSARRRHRTVLKRYERFFALKEKGVLKEKDSVFGMPKLKIARLKIKKEKTEGKTEEPQVVSEGGVQQAGVAAQTATQKASTATKLPKEEKKEKK
jgi:small basic protein (TIGR04137 family)